MPKSLWLPSARGHFRSVMRGQGDSSRLIRSWTPTGGDRPVGSETSASGRWPAVLLHDHRGRYGRIAARGGLVSIQADVPVGQVPGVATPRRDRQERGDPGSSPPDGNAPPPARHGKNRPVGSGPASPTRG